MHDVTEAGMEFQVAGYAADYRVRRPVEADAFDDYMSTLTLDQKFSILRLCTVYGIYPDSPAWLIFAASRHTIVDVEQRLHAVAELIGATTDVLLERSQETRGAVSAYEKALTP